MYLCDRYSLVAAASGGMGFDTVVAWHHNLFFCVAFYGQFARCLIVLLLYCQFGGYFDRKGRYSCGRLFNYLLDVAVDKHINHRGNDVIVFLADGFEVGVHYRYLDFVACFRLDFGQINFHSLVASIDGKSGG